MESVVDDETGEERDVLLRDLHTRDEWLGLRSRPSELLRLHPEAFWPMRVSPGDLWEPPDERRHGDVRTDAAARKRHTAAVRRSLQKFIATKLVRLEKMVRTGWFILSTVRVKVTRLTGLP